MDIRGIENASLDRMEKTLRERAKQICEKQSLEGVTYPDENRYTSQLLLQAIDAALQKAAYPGD